MHHPSEQPAEPTPSVATEPTAIVPAEPPAPAAEVAPAPALAGAPADGPSPEAAVAAEGAGAASIEPTPVADVDQSASAPEAPAEPAADASEAPAEPAADAPEASAGPAADAPAAPRAKSPDTDPAVCAALLAQHFPALFGEQARPLKLRIQADIQQRAPEVFTRRQLSIFLHRYTGSTRYLRALVDHAQRFDLDGQPAGEVAPDHLEAAKVELERRRALRQERIAQERQNRRPPRRNEGEATPVAAADGEAAAVPGQPRPPRAKRPPQGPRPADGPPGPRTPGAHADRRGEPRRGPRDARRDGAPDPARAPRTGARADAGPGASGEVRPEGRPAGRPNDRHPGRADGRTGDGRNNEARNNDARNGNGNGNNNDRRGGRPDARPSHPRAGGRPQARPDRDHDSGRPDPVAMDPDRYARAKLLRDFEQTTLTLNNFCVLKRLTPADLEAQLAQARAERAPRPMPTTK